MQEQLRRARTMEAMGTLVAGVAHEVRNPLFSISATLDNLEGEYGQESSYAEYAGALRAQVRRLSHLTRDLLEYGKPPRLHPRNTRPERLVRLALRACSLLHASGASTWSRTSTRAFPRWPSTRTGSTR